MEKIFILIFICHFIFFAEGSCDNFKTGVVLLIAPMTIVKYFRKNVFKNKLTRVYIVFVFPFIRMYVCSFVLLSRSWNYFRVLCASNLSGVYLTNHSSESIHIWTIGILEGRLSFHDSSPQGPCPGVGLEVKT